MSVYMSVYACMYVCLYVCSEMCNATSLHENLIVHIGSVSVYMSRCMCLCMSVCMPVYVCLFICVCSEMCNATSLHENLIVHIGSAHRLPTQWKNTSVHLCHSLFFLSDVYCSFYAKCTHNTLHSILWTHTATRQ